MSAHSRHHASAPATTVLRWYHHGIGLVFGLVVAVISAGKLNYGDWGALWIAGLLVRDGNREHLYRIDERDFALPRGDVWLDTIAHSDVTEFPHPYVHVPFLADVMSLVVRVMSFDVSVILLAIASGWALVVLIVSAWFLWFEEEIATITLLFGILLGWASIAFQSSLFLGQTSPLIFAGVAYGLAAARVHPVRAGIALGLVSAVKLTPIILVLICVVFPRARKAGLVALGTGAVAVLYSIVVSGWDVFTSWWDTLQDIKAAIMVAPVNGSIASQLSTNRVEDDSILVTIVHDPSLAASLIPPFVTLALIALVIVTALRSQEPWRIAAVGIFTVLTATGNILWDHYVLCAVLPLLGVLARGQNRIIYVVPVLGLFLFPPLARADSEMWLSWSSLIVLVGFVIALCIAELSRKDALPLRDRRLSFKKAS
ncbi:glycosyltransferase family 87 protein [uncultured Corynebacterium sp.]|uniref:glycosyltransferase family 87 protein n=1 Tax=uncultured Corynebacterium sp. TaxID=159447 RepID=UPI0025F9BD28|nr:glycosyltransferase family 87 protein [uncultured Corynebacterium sp.]